MEVGNLLLVSPDGMVDITKASLSSDGVTLTLNTGSTVVSSIRVICAVTKIGKAPRTKLFVSNFVQSAPSASFIQLTKADIYRIKSITTTVDGDVTARFKLDNGQRDYAYQRGSLSLVGNNLPTGTLTITFDYFSHSTSGDYFCINSYITSSLPDYYNSISTYSSISDGTVYDLKTCIDFRPTESDAGGISSGIDLVKINSRITSVINYYVPRIDSICIDKSGYIYASRGIPDDLPIAPITTQGNLQIATISVPAYTTNISDIKITLGKNRGFKMSDIQKLQDRIFNLEKFSLLSITESKLINYSIVDASTGLNRFKSGYLVDNFLNPNIIGDYFNPEFTVTYAGQGIIPDVESITVPLNVLNVSSMQLHGSLTDGFITLPYTTEIFAQQNLSTRITNVNPFSVFSWKGNLKLVPSTDNFMITVNLPTVFVTETVTITDYVNIPKYWGWAPTPGTHYSFAPTPNGWESSEAFWEMAKNVHRNDQYRL